MIGSILEGFILSEKKGVETLLFLSGWNDDTIYPSIDPTLYKGTNQMAKP